MKKTQIAAFLALAGAGLLSSQAQAGTTTWANNDVFLGFRQDGNATSEILIDLGQSSQYRDNTVSGSLNGIIGTGLGALLGSSFEGSSSSTAWFTDSTVHWGIVGNSGASNQTSYAGKPEFPNTLYISNPESNATPPAADINSVQNTAVTNMLTMKNHFIGQTTSTGLLNGVVQAPTDANNDTWTAEAGSAFGDNGQFGHFQDNPNAASKLDFYRLTRSSSSSTADGLKGTFTIDNTGQVFYNAPTPEPTTIALLGGAGMLLLARRRRTSAVA